MSHSAASLRPVPGDDYRSFADRARPLLDEGLERALAGVPSALGPVREVVGRTLGVKGKSGRRWRPLLAMATADALGTDPALAVDASVAVELTHTASLILDDLPCMDDSDTRRGEPAAHMMVGSSGAILLAIGMLAQAAELLGRSRDGAALASRWGRTFGFAGMAGGQAVDVELGGDARGAARRLYRRKTTVLAAFAVEAGARVAGAPEAGRDELYRFGLDIGWAYQLVDDAHDLEEDAALGRAPGGRRPLRQGQRLLRRALERIDTIDGLDARGADLLGTLAREIVRVPGDLPLDPAPTGEAGSC